MELRDAIKCNLENGLTVEHDRGMIFMMDEDTVYVEFDGGDDPVECEYFGVEEVDVAVDIFILYIIQEGDYTPARINWPKEGF